MALYISKFSSPVHNPIRTCASRVKKSSNYSQPSAKTTASTKTLQISYPPWIKKLSKHDRHLFLQIKTIRLRRLEGVVRKSQNLNPVLKSAKKKAENLLKKDSKGKLPYLPKIETKPKRKSKSYASAKSSATFVPIKPPSGKFHPTPFSLRYGFSSIDAAREAARVAREEKRKNRIPKPPPRIGSRRSTRICVVGDLKEETNMDLVNTSHDQQCDNEQETNSNVATTAFTTIESKGDGKESDCIEDKEYNTDSDLKRNCDNSKIKHCLVKLENIQVVDKTTEELCNKLICNNKLKSRNSVTRIRKPNKNTRKHADPKKKYNCKSIVKMENRGIPSKDRNLVKVKSITSLSKRRISRNAKLQSKISIRHIANNISKSCNTISKKKYKEKLSKVRSLSIDKSKDKKSKSSNINPDNTKDNKSKSSNISTNKSKDKVSNSTNINPDNSKTKKSKLSNNSIENSKDNKSKLSNINSENSKDKKSKSKNRIHQKVKQIKSKKQCSDLKIQDSMLDLSDKIKVDTLNKSSIGSTQRKSKSLASTNNNGQSTEILNFSKNVVNNPQKRKRKSLLSKLRSTKSKYTKKKLRLHRMKKRQCNNPSSKIDMNGIDLNNRTTWPKNHSSSRKSGDGLCKYPERCCLCMAYYLSMPIDKYHHDIQQIANIMVAKAFGMSSFDFRSYNKIIRDVIDGVAKDSGDSISLQNNKDKVGSLRRTAKRKLKKTNLEKKNKVVNANLTRVHTDLNKKTETSIIVDMQAPADLRDCKNDLKSKSEINENTRIKSPIKCQPRIECFTSYASRDKFYSEVFRHSLQHKNSSTLNHNIDAKPPSFNDDDNDDAYMSDFGDYVSASRYDVNGYSSYYSDCADVTSESDLDDCEEELDSWLQERHPLTTALNASSKVQLGYHDNTSSLVNKSGSVIDDSETKELIYELNTYREKHPTFFNVPTKFCSCENQNKFKGDGFESLLSQGTKPSEDISECKCARVE